MPMLPDPLPIWLSLLLVLVAAPMLALATVAVVQAALKRLLRGHDAPVLRRVVQDGRGATHLAAALLAALAVLPEVDLPTAMARIIGRGLGLALVASLG